MQIIKHVILLLKIDFIHSMINANFPQEEQNGNV